MESKCPDAKPGEPCRCQRRLMVVNQLIISLTTERTGLQQDIHDLENCRGDTVLQSWRRKLADVDSRLDGLCQEKATLENRIGIPVS